MFDAAMPIEVGSSAGIINDLIDFFSGTVDATAMIAQLVAVVVAVFIAIVVYRVAGAKILVSAANRSDNFVGKTAAFCLHVVRDILFSVVAGMLLSLFIWALTSTGFITNTHELVLARFANSIFYAWALLLVIMQCLSLILGNRMFSPGLRNFARTAFWVLAALQIVGILPVIVEWMQSCLLPVGSDKLTVWTLFVGIVTLFLTLGIAVRLSDACEGAIMKAKDLELNTKVVFARLCRVTLIVAGVLVGLSSVGIDFTVLSVFGGAIGVGIGFGMQKIASNYISGFIILFDKSVKLGDMVQVAGFTGIITRINTRYSVLRNTSGEELIVPNESFVTGNVKNYSLTESACLTTLDVSCAYESDVEKALTVLAECVKAQPRVMKSREPWFVVTEFADSGINLRAGFWVDDPRKGTAGLKSVIFKEVLRRYSEEGIEIPYNKLEVKVTEGDLAQAPVLN